MNARLFTFVGGETGPWNVADVKSILGEPLDIGKRLNIVNGSVSVEPGAAKCLLRGVTSNERYTTRPEKNQLMAKQAVLGRCESNCAALIPIRKAASWWNLTQDERRGIFEESSNHVKTGLKYLPTVARRLHHCRNLGENEPFDFLTWFDYPSSDSAAFDQMLAELRASEEWTYVEREIDIRVVRDQV